MTEQMPQLAPEVVDLAWEAAQASNRAFDTLLEAEANLTKVQEVARLAVTGVNINGEAFEALEQERTNARANLALLGDMAAPVMLLPNSPFSRNTAEVATEAVEVEVPEELENLPADYKGRVIARYGETKGTVARRIKDGILPESYQLPELGVFAERIVALAPSHEAFTKKDWRPEVVFVPEGLSFEQWGDLLSEQELQDGQQSDGVWQSWYDYANTLTDLTFPEATDLTSGT